MLLRFLGHEVATAHDGADALSAAASFLPDVAILDIGLPGMSGYDLARALRARLQQAPRVPRVPRAWLQRGAPVGRA